MAARWRVLRRRSRRRSTAPLDSEARALLLYTSGTTGKPKGTIHTHGGCLAQMGKEIWLGFDHRAGRPVFLAVRYRLDDGAVDDHRQPSVRRNHLSVRWRAGLSGAGRLWETIERHRITTFGVSPTAIRVLSKTAGELPAMERCGCWGRRASLGTMRSWMWFFERVGRRAVPHH